MTKRTTEAMYRALATKALTQVARELRQRETPAEDRLWMVLRNRNLAGLKFRRQHPVAGTAYVADFLCYAARLIIEVDGGVHDSQTVNDRIRQENLEGLGYSVVRFRNEDVLENLESVLFTVVTAVKHMNERLLTEEALTPSTSPSGRGVRTTAKTTRRSSARQPESTTVAKSLLAHTDNSSQPVCSDPPRPEGEGLGVRADRDGAP